MDINADKVLHFKEVLEYLIGQFTGKDIQPPYCSVCLAYLEIVLVEFKGRRGDEVLRVHSGS